MSGVLLSAVLCVLVLRALGRSGRPAPAPEADRWWVARADRGVRRLGADTVRGARVLARLDAARRDRTGRPWP